MKIVVKYELKIYARDNGTLPLLEWLENLDRKVRGRVKERLDRLRLGNCGDYKQIAEKIFELRFKFGSGYRLYYGKEGKDIKKAIDYWHNYVETMNNDKTS